MPGILKTIGRVAKTAGKVAVRETVGISLPGLDPPRRQGSGQLTTILGAAMIGLGAYLLVAEKGGEAYVGLMSGGLALLLGADAGVIATMMRPGRQKDGKE